MNTAFSSFLRDRPLLRRFLSHFLIVALGFNLLCAMIVTYVIRIGSGLFENWVFSMCIGTLAVILIEGGRLLIWREAKPPALLITLLITAAIPIAYRAGTLAAAQLLGLPFDRVLATQSEKAVPMFIFTVLVSLLISWFLWNRVRFAELVAEKEAEKARAAAVEKQAMQAQLQMLQAQIEPHMLFNTLANLQGLIAVDPPRAQRMLDQLIQYLRATLLASRSGHTTLGHEFSLMQAFLGLMSVRMGSRLTYDLRLPAELRDQPVPPMLLQPLIENAIKHGLEPKVLGGHIGVEARREAGALTLTVADTGLGLEVASAGAGGTNVGLANLRERLHALYGEHATFSLTPNTPEGAIAHITIPL